MHRYFLIIVCKWTARNFLMDGEQLEVTMNLRKRFYKEKVSKLSILSILVKIPTASCIES